MNKKILISSVFPFLLAGCGSPLVPRYDGPYADDKQVPAIELKFHSLKLDTIPLVPYSFCFLDSLLVVEEDMTRERANIFKVYFNNKLVSQFGMVGEGPEEFSFANLVSSGKAVKGNFSVFENSGLRQISLDSTNFEPVINKIPVPQEMFMLNSVCMFNDSVIIGSKFGDCQLSKFNPKTQEFTEYNYFEKPGAYSKVDNFYMTNQLYQCSPRSNGRYIVMAYYHLKIIDIVDMLDMSLHKRIFFRGYDSNEYTIGDDGNIIFDDETATDFFTRVAAYEDSFYVLCFDRRKEGTSKDISNMLSTIYEMDYDGNLINTYEPDVLVSSILVKDKEMYAIALDPVQTEFMICKSSLR